MGRGSLRFPQMLHDSLHHGRSKTALVRLKAKFVEPFREWLVIIYPMLQHPPRSLWRKMRVKEKGQFCAAITAVCHLRTNIIISADKDSLLLFSHKRHVFGPTTISVQNVQ